MAYAILLHQRNKHFSALQRLITLTAIKGGVDDMVRIFVVIELQNLINLHVSMLLEHVDC